MFLVFSSYIGERKNGKAKEIRKGKEPNAKDVIGYIANGIAKEIEREKDCDEDTSHLKDLKKICELLTKPE